MNASQITSRLVNSQPAHIRLAIAKAILPDPPSWITHEQLIDGEDFGFMATLHEVLHITRKILRKYGI